MQLPVFAPVVFAATVKLPEFWQHDLAQWFQHIEVQFHFCGITVDDIKYYHVVAAPAAGKYNTLKAQLLRVFRLSNEERAARLLTLNGLGDSKPTELMENMLVLLGAGDTSFLFVMHWPVPLLCTQRITVASHRNTQEQPLHCSWWQRKKIAVRDCLRPTRLSSKLVWG